MIRYVDFITPEEYMELRRKVGWMEFPLEEARNCVENAYLVICVRNDADKAIGVVRLLWDGGYVAKKIAEFLYKKIRPANAGRTYDNTQ